MSYTLSTLRQVQKALLDGDQLGAMKHLNELIEKWELMQQSRIAYRQSRKELQDARLPGN